MCGAMTASYMTRQIRRASMTRRVRTIFVPILHHVLLVHSAPMARTTSGTARVSPATPAATLHLLGHNLAHHARPRPAATARQDQIQPGALYVPWAISAQAVPVTSSPATLAATLLLLGLTPARPVSLASFRFNLAQTHRTHVLPVWRASFRFNPGQTHRMRVLLVVLASFLLKRVQAHVLHVLLASFRFNLAQTHRMRALPAWRASFRFNLAQTHRIPALHAHQANTPAPLEPVT